jgi:hypothetical protein
MNDRDLAALDYALANRRVAVSTADSVAELTNERGVFEVVAELLRRSRGILENRNVGPDDVVSFQSVLDDWADEWEQEPLPVALLESETSESTKGIGSSVEPDPRDNTIDWISPNDLWSMERRGEDFGDGRVILYDNSKVRLRALETAVRSLFTGGDIGEGVALVPLPEATLPRAFQGDLPPEHYPTAKLHLRERGGSLAEEGKNVYRVDVLFSWRAVKLVARRRAADMQPSTIVEVEES